MATEIGKKEQHLKKNPSVSSSASGSSSITSDSSGEHFVLPNIPLPKSSMSAAEMQKERETYVSHQNYLNDMPGYDPNRIPSSVFTTKPPSTEWSLASNESLFSIHHGNFSFSIDDFGLAPPVREIPVIEDSVHAITEINPIPHSLPQPPPVKKPQGSEKETKPNQVEKSDSESDDEEKGQEFIVFQNENEEDKINHKVLVKFEPCVEEIKPEDLTSTVSHSPSISCLSDTSNNSMSSFAFPMLQKGGGIATPTMESISHKRRPENQLIRPSRTQWQPQPASYTYTQSEFQPQRKLSKRFESRTESPKASRTAWFSCFYCPYPRDLFK